MPSVRHRSADETLLLVRPFASRLLRPLLTSHSVSPRRPFSRKAGSPRVRTHSFTAHPPDLRHLSLGHKSFAVFCPLALLGGAFYPVLVHQVAVSLHASSPRSVALPQLRFASLAVTSSRWDLHPQECARAGRTKSRGENPAASMIDVVRHFGETVLRILVRPPIRPGTERLPAASQNASGASPPWGLCSLQIEPLAQRVDFL